MFPVQFGIGHRNQALAVHGWDRSAEAPPATEFYVDVIWFWIRCAVLLRFGREEVGLIADLGCLAPTQLSRRQRAATPLRLACLVSGHAAQDVAEYSVADRP